MGLLDKIVDVLFSIFDYEGELPENKNKSKEEIRKEYYQKGKDFEEYVVNLFDRRNYFTLVDWTRDLDINGIRPESNKNPDIIMRYNPTKEKIAIECKYRSSYYTSKTTHKQIVYTDKKHKIDRYKEYQKTEKIPTFLVIGVGGTPKDPKYLYCIPINKIKYEEMFVSVISEYMHVPNKNFFWDSRKKMLK